MSRNSPKTFLPQECARHACGGPQPIDCKYSNWNQWGDCDKCNGALAVDLLIEELKIGLGHFLKEFLEMEFNMEFLFMEHKSWFFI